MTLKNLIFSRYCVQTGLFVDVTLNNLQPNTTYFYIVGNDAKWSSEFSFRTQPVSDPKTVSFGVYGDMGVLFSNVTIELLTKMTETNQLDFVLHMGDISYAGLQKT